MAPTSRPLITVIGSLNYDSITYVERPARPGESITALDSQEGPGGKGANQAVAAHRLNREKRDSKGTIDVSMVGAVGGKDALGPDVLSNLYADGIDVSRVLTRADWRTGRATITIDSSTGESYVVLTPGANHSLRPEDFPTVDSLLVRDGRRPNLLILQLEIPLKTVERIVTIAGQEKIPVLLNPAPADSLLTPTWKFVTHLIANETEAAILAGEELENIQRQWVVGWEAVADKFHGLGVKYVVITLGANGVIFSDKVGGAVHRKAVRVRKVIDTTTAGDTFVGAYAESIVQQDPNKLNIGLAVDRALQAAACVVQKAGTQNTIPWDGDMFRILKRRDSEYVPRPSQ
jgi:ribokinase